MHGLVVASAGRTGQVVLRELAIVVVDVGPGLVRHHDAWRRSRRGSISVSLVAAWCEGIWAMS